MIRRSLLVLPLLVAAAPVSGPGEIKTFKDWAVGCDNTKRCTIASLGPENAVAPGVMLSLIREAGAEGAMRLTLSAHDDALRPAGVAIDGKRIGGVPGDPATVAQLVPLLANSRSIDIIDAAGKRIAALSPTGIAAALRYADAAQGRTGTTTAIVARGAKPASTVPPAPALPLITAVKPEGRAVMPNARQALALKRSANCAGETGAATPEAFALGNGRALVLIPCDSGAYNAMSAVFVIDNGKPAPARFDAPVGFGEARNVPVVVNASYKGGVLTSYAKARGLGDCGTSQSFVWDGARFRLSEQAEMGECRGNPNFITTWRARVVQR